MEKKFRSTTQHLGLEEKPKEMKEIEKTPLSLQKEKWIIHLMRVSSSSAVYTIVCVCLNSQSLLL